MRLMFWTVGCLFMGWTIVHLATELWLWGMTGRYLRILTLGEVVRLFAPNSLGIQAVLGGVPLSPITLLLGAALMWRGRRDQAVQ